MTMNPTPNESLDRRTWMGRVGLGAAALGSLPSLLSSCSDARGNVSNSLLRAEQALILRRQMADLGFARPIPVQAPNGDEDRLPNFIGSFAKGLPHNANGEVDGNAYRSFRQALDQRNFSALESLMAGTRRFVTPKAGMTFALQGADPSSFAMPAPPRFDSAEEAGEIVEVYWMALLRDLHFADWDQSIDVAAAITDLSNLSDFRGPRANGLITSRTLFRGTTPGELTGPYLSQFLWRDAQMGAQKISGTIATDLAGIDHMTSFGEWLRVQQGMTPTASAAKDPTPRYIRNLRDLAAYVHVDRVFQAHFHAALFMLYSNMPFSPTFDDYNDSVAMEGYVNSGRQHVLDMVVRICVLAMRTVWFQKWFVHRRLRPEVFAGRIEAMRQGLANYPIHNEALASDAVARTLSRYGTALLPQAYIEGSPMHPAYGAGHATVAGACTTILKAMFDESVVLPETLIPNADGTALVPYTGPGTGTLTVGGELDKLAGNIAYGRNGAGVHWRTDAVESLLLGEAVAEAFLREEKAVLPEDVTFRFTRFDGSQAVI